MERYRLYIDESGDHVMSDEAALRKEGHRYLALVGCWIRGDKYKQFHDDLTSLKQTHFPHNPDEPVILHREDIVACRGSFWRLHQQAAKQAFDDDWLELLHRTDFMLCGIVIDKLALRQKYWRPFHPYHTALEFLLQRYCGYLNHVSRKGDVMAESRGGRENKELAKEFTRIWTDGDMQHDAEFVQRALTSRELKLKQKNHNIAGLQLADLLAHPLRLYVLTRNQATTTQPTEFEKRVFRLLESKLNRNLYTGGQVKGYGWSLFPHK